MQSQHGGALRSVEDVAQLLASWKPGVYSKERENAYFDAPGEEEWMTFLPDPRAAPGTDPVS